MYPIQERCCDRGNHGGEIDTLRACGVAQMPGIPTLRYHFREIEAEDESGRLWLEYHLSGVFVVLGDACEYQLIYITQVDML